LTANLRMGKCVALFLPLTVSLAASEGESFLLRARVFLPRMSRGLCTCQICPPCQRQIAIRVSASSHCLVQCMARMRQTRGHCPACLPPASCLDTPVPLSAPSTGHAPTHARQHQSRLVNSSTSRVLPWPRTRMPRKDGGHAGASTSDMRACALPPPLHQDACKQGLHELDPCRAKSACSGANRRLATQRVRRRPGGAPCRRRPRERRTSSSG